MKWNIYAVDGTSAPVMLKEGTSERLGRAMRQASALAPAYQASGATVFVAQSLESAKRIEVPCHETETAQQRRTRIEAMGKALNFSR